MFTATAMFVVYWIIHDRQIYASLNFQLVMSLPAMSLGLRFWASRKGGKGGGGHFQHWAQIAWLPLG